MSQTVIGRRFRQLLIKRIAEERDLPVSNIEIVNIEQFPVNKWGHVGTVDVTYMPGKVYRAIYGFDSLANVSIYMD